MAADDYRSKQSAHALERKAIRALMDDTGVTNSQARSVLHREQSNSLLLQRARVFQNNQPSRPAPQILAQNTQLPAQPILPPPVAGQNVPPTVTPVFGTPLQLDFVAIGGDLESIIVYAVIV